MEGWMSRCMLVGTCLYVWMHVGLYMYVFLDGCIHVGLFIMYACMHTSCLCMYACRPICIYACLCMYMYACMHA